MSIHKLSFVLFLIVVNTIGCSRVLQRDKDTGVLGDIPISEEWVPREERKITYANEKYLPARKNSSLTQDYYIQKPPPAYIASARDIQTALRNAGYTSLKVDGIIGPQTNSAIKSFQKENNLKADGVVGVRTWNFLRKYFYTPASNFITPLDSQKEDIVATTFSSEDTISHPITSEEISSPEAKTSTNFYPKKALCRVSNLRWKRFMPFIGGGIALVGVVIYIYRHH